MQSINRDVFSTVIMKVVFKFILLENCIQRILKK